MPPGSKPTKSQNWGSSGVTKILTGTVKAEKFEVSSPAGGRAKEVIHLSFDGEKHYRWWTGGDSFATDVLDQKSFVVIGLWDMIWDPGWESLHEKERRVDPKLGEIVVYDRHGVEFEFAKDRDWLLVKREGHGAKLEVTELTQISGRWLPTKMFESGLGLTIPGDTYCEVSYKLLPAERDPNFVPEMKEGAVWSEKGVLYQVEAGRLVRQANQPSHLLENVKIGGGLAALGLLLGGLGYQLHKLFGKSNGSIFDSN